MQGKDRLSYEASRLISEALRLLRPTDTIDHDEDDQNARSPKKTDISSEQIYWFRLAEIHMDDPVETALNRDQTIHFHLSEIERSQFPFFS